MAREMLLQELVASYRPLYPEPYSWEETANYLYAEESELMEELTESLKLYGWREPVVLSVEDDLTEGTPSSILNGTHRVVIALREGVVTIPVATRAELPPEPEKPLLTAKLKLKKGAELTEDEDSLLLDTLRSWPLNKDLWITSSVCFGSRSGWDVLLDFDDETYAAALASKIRKLVKAALPNHVFSVTVEPDEFYEE